MYNRYNSRCIKVVQAAAVLKVSTSKGSLSSLGFNFSKLYFTCLRKLDLVYTITKNVEKFVEECLLTRYSKRTLSIISGHWNTFFSGTLTTSSFVWF